MWNDDLCNRHVVGYDELNETQREHLKKILNAKFPFDVYERHRDFRTRAFENEIKNKKMLDGAIQFYPELIRPEKIVGNLSGCAMVMTAGGEGERLRLSLEALGHTGDKISDFTKATFPLPDFYQDFGTLQTNLALIGSLEKKYGVDIPVIVTTGPDGSATARVIPEIIEKNGRFGLKNLLVVSQGERLHLTKDDKVAWAEAEDGPEPVTHPDETGGPIMSLKEKKPGMDNTPLDWLAKRGVEKILVLQATALYNPELIFALAEADSCFDCIGAGILREKFESDDPYGTYAGIEKQGKKSVVILEQNIRNEETRGIKNGSYHLPYNTGFYRFGTSLLDQCSLPDFATPPKEILPGLERTPKVGYAAIDLISLAQNPAVVAVPTEWFAVLKKADDLPKLAELGKSCGLDKLCSECKTKGF